MYCKNCEQKLPDDAKFCNNCGLKVLDIQQGQMQTEYTAPRPFQPYSSIDYNQGMINKTVFKGRQTTTGSSGTIKFGGSKKAGKNGKKKAAGIIAILVILVLAAIILVKFTGLFSNPKLKLGETTDETSVTISGSGGIVSVNDPASAISGFAITVSPDTYDTSLNFDVSTTEIKGHTFGNEFTPITPIITVDNGHKFSDRPMHVSIPISIAEDEFAMGFFYDRKTGELEAIPFEDISNTRISLLTNHFSDIVVSKIKISELEKLTSTSKTNADSGFVPGVDDWHFVNYGSALAPDGHCAGQSLTMSWYYQEKHLGENEPHLYGMFDNNGDAKTESFWQDDSEAYRLASVVQHYINWNSLEFNNYLDFSSKDQTKVFYAFSYAIMITGDPQFMGIYHYDSYGNIAGGHAIVAYKVEGDRIYVADPNYPGQKDRYCELGNSGFKPYSSGSNATDISANGAVLYTDMNFVAASALIDFSLIAENYNMMLEGTVGDSEFPESVFEIMTEYGSLDSIPWSTETNVSLGKDFVASLPDNMKDKTMIKVTPLADYLFYSIYLNGSTEAVQEPVVDIYDGILYFEVDLTEGSNHISFLVQQEVYANYYSFVDFIDINIEYSPNVTQATTTETTQQNSGSLLSKLPGKYELTQIGGVGAPGSPDTSITYGYFYIYDDGTLTVHQESKDTDPIHWVGTWTMKGKIVNINGIDYIFSGTTLTMDSEYPWIYQKVQ